MLRKIAELQQQSPRVLFGALLVAILLTAVIASQLQIDPSFSTLVGQESEYNRNDRVLNAAFEQNDALIILLTEDRSTILENAVRLESEETSAYIERLRETVAQSSYVLDTTPTMYSDDGRTARLTLLLHVPESTDGFKKVLAELELLVAASGEPPGIETKVTGLPVVLDRVSTLLITDNLVTILITLLFIFAILYWYSRDLTYTLITLAAPVSSLLMLAAAMVILDIQVTITLAAVGVLVLGLGADYSIHISAHYRRARRDHEGHRQALAHVMDDLAIPITASFITTLAGFSALILGISPSSQSQGIVLAIAITLIFLNTFLVFPLLITLFGQRVNIKENPLFSLMKRGLSRLAVFQANHAKTVIAIVLGITVIMLYGASQVEFSTSNSNWIPDDDPISEGFREVNYAFGDTDSIQVVLVAREGDLRNVQTARDVNRLATLFAGIGNVDRVENPYAGLSYDTAELHDAITNTALREEFSDDYRVTTLRLVSGNLDQNEAGESIVLEEVRRLIERYPVHGTDVSLFGDVVRFSELGETLQRDTGVTTMLGLGFVFLVASMIYASITIGLLALIPIIIAVIWAVGLMGLFGVPFTSLSTGIISLVLGIGVDFSIHLVDGINKLRPRGIEFAIRETLDTTGSAIVLSSMTTFVGFLALTFAQLLGTQRLGWSLAFSILAVFTVTITLVPAVLSLRKVKA